MAGHRRAALLHHSNPKNTEFPLSYPISVLQTWSRKERAGYKDVNATSTESVHGQQITTLTTKNTKICMCESELRGLPLPYSPSGNFVLRKPWQTATNSHHALHFGLSLTTANFFRRPPFLLVMIKTFSQSQFPSCFCTLGLSFPKRLPVPNRLLSFTGGKECWEIEWLVSDSANSVACHHNTGR